MFIQQIVNGLTIGSTYALIAIGFSMIFSILELINFANGSVYMVGAYVSLMFIGMLGTRYAVLAIILALIVNGAVGFILEKVALSGLRKKNAPKLSALISTLGMAIFLDNFVLVTFGATSKTYPNLLDFGKYYIGDVIINSTQMIIFAVACVMMGMLSYIVYFTKTGKSMSATAQNLEAARLMGININRIISLTFVISGVLAGISGAMYGMNYQVLETGIGARIGVKVFASAILGGVGSLPGAVVGGLSIGILETMAAGYISSGYRDSISFVVLITVLLIRPSGILGKKQINKV